MTRMNIYVPDVLAGEVRQRHLPISAVCQRALRREIERTEPVSETVTVVDRHGGQHDYDADGWRKDDDGHLFVTKDGENVAIFAQGEGEVAVPAKPGPEVSGIVTVIDQTGRHHNFEADDWNSDTTGFVEVVKDSKRVASFGPGCIGVFRREARRGPLPAKD